MLIMNRRCDAERQEGVAYYMMPRYHLVNVTVSVREDLFWKRFGNLNKRTLEYHSVKSVLYRKNSTFVDRRVQRSERETVFGLNAVWIRTGVNPTSSMKCISYNEIGYDTRYYGVPELLRDKGHRRISRIDVPRPHEGLNSCKNRETYTFFSGSAHRHVSNAFPVLPHSFVQG